MKQIILIFTASVLLFSCNPNKTPKGSDDKKAITVSIVPQKTFVEKITGNDFQINVLIPPGVTPEAGNLLPSQLKLIANSELWFRMGHIGFEYSWKDKIEQANRKMKVVDLSEGMDLIAETEGHGDHVHESGIDPHIWMSPRLVKKMAARILDEVIALNPEKEAEYKENYLKFVEEADQLDAEIKNLLKDSEGKMFITFHPSLSYYARDYGLEQLTLESGGKEPTPQHMAGVIRISKAENIDVIYIQSEFDREHARVFAEEINGRVIQISPLAPNWAENLLEMTRIFVENF
jgi:zinc transport system substrate-binding protein